MWKTVKNFMTTLKHFSVKEQSLKVYKFKYNPLLLKHLIKFIMFSH